MASKFEQLVQDFETNIGDPSIAILRGQKEKANNRNHPRIVCIPKGGPIVPTERPGYELLPNGKKSRRIADRKFKIEVECWGPDEETTEALYFNAVNAWRKATHNSLEFGEEIWPHESEDQAGNDEDGDVIAFSFSISMPIWEGQIPILTPTVVPGRTLTTLTGTENTVKLDKPTEANPDGNPEDPLNQENFSQ